MTGRRLLALALLLPVLAGCGFHPLYGAADQAAISHLPDIFVQPIPERSGQELRLALPHRLAGASEAEPQGYTLSVGVSISGEGAARRPGQLRRGSADRAGRGRAARLGDRPRQPGPVSRKTRPAALPRQSLDDVAPSAGPGQRPGLP